MPNVEVGTTANTVLSGYQFVDGIQVTDGMLVLVKNQTNPNQNGIYRAGSGPWVLLGYNNDRKTWFDAVSSGIQYYGQLGYFEGAVNVARGTQYAQLFQITYDPNAELSVGTTVTIANVAASAVDHYDFYTGLYMEASDIRVTQLDDDRTTQQTGQPIGGLNTLPGTSYLVPGNDKLGQPNNEVPYGCGSHQGLPLGFAEIPKSGEITNYQIVGNWVNNNGERCVFVTEDPFVPNLYVGIGGWFTYLYGPFDYLCVWDNNNGQLCTWAGVAYTGIVDWVSEIPPPNIR